MSESILLAFEYWYVVLPIAAYLAVAMWFLVKWKSLFIALTWPLFMLFYGGPQ